MGCLYCRDINNQDYFLGVNLKCIGNTLYTLSCGCYEYDSLIHRRLTTLVFILYMFLLVICFHFLSVLFGLFGYWWGNVISMHLCSTNTHMELFFGCSLDGLFIIFLATNVVYLIVIVYFACCVSDCCYYSLNRKPENLQPLFVPQQCYGT
jgi:hypothetical protein